MGLPVRTCSRACAPKPSRYGAEIAKGHVERLEQTEHGFVAVMADGTRHSARRVLLATGTEDVPPPLDLPDRKAAVQRGLLRYCPICDAYEVTGRKIALAGTRRCRVKEALLLRGYTADLSLITLRDTWELPDMERSQLAAAGIKIIEAPAAELVLEDQALAVRTVDDTWHRFDTLYVALGLRARSGLAIALGAQRDPEGALTVTAPSGDERAGPLCCRGRGARAGADCRCHGPGGDRRNGHSQRFGPGEGLGEERVGRVRARGRPGGRTGTRSLGFDLPILSPKSSEFA